MDIKIDCVIVRLLLYWGWVVSAMYTPGNKRTKQMVGIHIYYLLEKFSFIHSYILPVHAIMAAFEMELMTLPMNRVVRSGAIPIRIHDTVVGTDIHSKVFLLPTLDDK